MTASNAAKLLDGLAYGSEGIVFCLDDINKKV